MFQIFTDLHGNHAVVTLVGQADPTAVRDLRKELALLVRLGYRQLILDFQKLEAIYSDGLGVIIDVGLQLRRDGGWIRIINPPPRINDLLDYCGLRKLLAGGPNMHAAPT
jgi:anti-anti-sigma factor